MADGKPEPGWTIDLRDPKATKKASSSFCPCITCKKYESDLKEDIEECLNCMEEYTKKTIKVIYHEGKNNG